MKATRNGDIVNICVKEIIYIINGCIEKEIQAGDLKLIDIQN